MYEEYFGLKRSPFRITPDPSLFYDGGQRGDILGALVYAVHRGEGIIKVVGEVGSGKTMLCRMLQQELPDSVEIIYIANPSVSPEDILFVIATELKFDINREASKHEVVSMLQNYLLHKHAEGKQVVLFVEEAQSMPLETLEEIRLLSNLETDQFKLLQIILFGQPELDLNLANNSIRQLRERITHDFNLSPLSTRDIHKYLNFRMREVGYTGPELISLKVAESMAKHSEGLLRRINILADKMLLSAYAEGTHTITGHHLMAAVNDSGFSRLSGRGTGFRLAWIAGILLLLLAIAFGLSRQQNLFPALWMNGQSPVTHTEADGQKITAKIIPFSEPETAVQKLPGLEDAEQAVRPLAPDENRHEEQQAAEQKMVENSPPETITVQTRQEKDQPAPQDLQLSSKKNQQFMGKLDKVIQNQPVEALTSSKRFDDYAQWLEHKIELSKQWLRGANTQSVSIQVMMTGQSAARELVKYLKTQWSLELDKTYIYEVKLKERTIYRVFYGEFPSIKDGQEEIKRLPDSVQVNSPYLHSINRMQKALL